MNIKYIINFIEQYRYATIKGKTDEMVAFLQKNERDKSYNNAIKILAALSGWIFFVMALYAVFFKDIITNKDIIAVIALGFIYLIYGNEYRRIK